MPYNICQSVRHVLNFVRALICRQTALSIEGMELKVEWISSTPPDSTDKKSYSTLQKLLVCCCFDW